jgi:hypothetical protein
LIHGRNLGRRADRTWISAIDLVSAISSPNSIYPSSIGTKGIVTTTHPATPIHVVRSGGNCFRGCSNAKLAKIIAALNAMKPRYVAVAN